MGFWVGIKKALNSTVGTSGFKPLNDMIQDVKNTVIGQRTLAASDSVIKILWAKPSQDITGGDTTTVGTITPTVGGSVRVVAKVVINYFQSGDFILLDVYQGSTQVARLRKDLTSTNYAATHTLVLDLPVTKNTVYTVRVYGGSNRHNIENVSVCANIVDTSLVG